MQNILFICSRNQWRSPTGENIWRNHPALNVRSAGTSPNARKTVNVHDIRWADVIFVMETKHKNRLTANFSKLLTHKKLKVLDIVDDYGYMDEELIAMLNTDVSEYLNITPLNNVYNKKK